MISLKKYLDMNSPGVLVQEAEPVPAPELDGLSPATLESYRTLLCTMGKTAVQISPVLGSDLESNLQRLEHRVSFQPTPESVKQVEKQVEIQLQEWGGRVADHLKAKAEEVREIMVALAKTAESVGSRDQGYSSRFKEVTGRTGAHRPSRRSDATPVFACEASVLAEEQRGPDEPRQPRVSGAAARRSFDL